MLGDLKYAIGQMARNRGLTLVALLTLALGIGVNATVFTVLNVFVYRMPQYPEPDRLVLVYGTMPQSQFAGLAPANARDIVAQNSVFMQASPYCFDFSSVTNPGGLASRIVAQSVAGNFFTTLGISPTLGRALQPADDRPGHNDVVVASERFWRERLGADPNAVGSVLRLDGRPVTVVGVMPENVQDYIGVGPVDLWHPLGYGEDTWGIRDNDWMSFVARLKPGVTVAQAQAQLNTIAAHLAQDHPATNARRGLNVLPYKNARTLFSGPIVWTILGLTLFVLLIACVNLANLQLARMAARTRELALRVALGASRARLVRQLLTESLLLSAAGGGLGLLVAAWGNRLVSSRMHFGNENLTIPFPMDYRVLGFTLAASVATGIVFGLVPGLVASRPDVNSAIKQGGRGVSADRSRHRLRRALVVAELALALASLAGAAFFVRGFQKLARGDLGWKSGNLVSGCFVLPQGRYPTDDDSRRVVERIRAALARLPGVDAAVVSGAIPIAGQFSHRTNFVIEGQALPPAGQEPLALAERVTPGYFSALGMNVLAGRGIDETDRADSRRVAVINQTMAAKFWPEGDAVGHRIGSADPKNPDWREIVGVVNDIPDLTNAALTRFQVYRPFSQDPERWLTFALRAQGPKSGLPEAARRAVAAIDPDLGVYELGTVDQLIEEGMANFTVAEQTLMMAAVLGLFLALIGIYGVIANLAAQRTQEIGIRMALGARASSILWLVLRDGARLASVGMAAGLVLALWLGRGLSLALPIISGFDPLPVAGLALLLMVASLAACAVPALRATYIDPVQALRSE